MQRSVTNRRRNELREAFTLFDKDGDGTIDSNELKTVMKTAGLHPTDRDIERLIRVCDADRSGVIEFNEFILMMHENDKISEEDVRSGFRIFDKDGDGNITPSELKFCVKDLGIKLNDQEVEDMIAMADMDGDGKIQYNEFVTVMFNKKN